MSRTVKDSGLRADFPVSNITPRRITGVRSVPVRVLEALAPDIVHLRPGRGVGTLVQSVRDAVFVRVERATGLVDDGVGGAALGVDVRPRGRTRALVEPVVHAVAV